MARTLDGREQLKRWMRKEGIGPKRAGQRLDADHGQISRILAGSRRPGLDLAARIQTATGIPVSAWARPPRPDPVP